MEFINARRLRLCESCRTQFTIDQHKQCPTCESKGRRVWDRLTLITGRRFGKTRIGAVAAGEEATIPNSVVWCCAPTNPKLHRYVIPAMQELIPTDWVHNWNSEYLDLRLKNGSLIHFQTLEDPDQGRGQGLDALWIDEVCELTRKHWEVIRPSLAGDTVAFFTSSPRGYDWVYDELYRPAEEGIPGYWACQAKTSDSANPRISKEFLDRERTQMSDTMFRQEYEADFVTFQGAVYGALVDQQILRTTAEIQKIIPEWPKIDTWRQVIVGVDTGADHPFGAVKLVSTEKGLVVVDEYLERDRVFAQHAAYIKHMAGSPNAKYSLNKNERQQTLELAQHGIYCQKAQNDVVSGTERVKSWLQTKQMWFIESAVPQTIKQMKAYRWAENYFPKTEAKRNIEKAYKKNDELPDCIRYAVMTWPVLPKSAPVSDDNLRDVSAFSDEARASIERMRRLDGRPAEKLSVVGDFWA